jgi:TolA-binding protein
MSDNDRITQLEQQLRAALGRISELEARVQTIRKNTNRAISGHATILESLVDHTRYVPPAGRKLVFPRTAVDVGEAA